MRTDAHRWLGCVGFSHRIHGTHRSFWRRRASHRCHRCPQMVWLRRVLPRNSRNTQKRMVEKSLPRMLTDGLAAYGSPTDFTEYRCSIRGCSSLCCTNRALVHQHCNPPTEITEHTEASGVEEPPTDAHRCAQMVWLRRVLWEDSLVGCVGMAGCHTLLICAHPCNLWENILCQKLLWFLWVLWEDGLVAAWVWQDAIPSYSLHCLLCWCSGDKCTPLKFATRLQNIFPNFVNDYFSLSD